MVNAVLPYSVYNHHAEARGSGKSSNKGTAFNHAFAGGGSAGVVDGRDGSGVGENDLGEPNASALAS